MASQNIVHLVPNAILKQQTNLQHRYWQIRLLVLHKLAVMFYISQGNRCKKTTYDHFFAEGVPKSTIYDTTKRFENSGNIEYKPLSGRLKTVATIQAIRKIKSAFEKKPAKAKKVVPRYVQNQEARARSGARFVCDKVRQKRLVIDDETYVPKNSKNVLDENFTIAQILKILNSMIKSNITPNFLKETRKLCTNGVQKENGEHGSLNDLKGRGRKRGTSCPKAEEKLRIKEKCDIRSYRKQKVPRRSADQQDRALKRAKQLYNLLLNGKERCSLMNDETYIKMDTKTLPGQQLYTAKKREVVTFTEPNVRKRLLAVYRKHKDPPLFSPDLALAHYAQSTLELLKAGKVDFVSKDINPSNCPQLRSIEHYWAIVKRKTRRDNMKEFKKNWGAAVRKVDAKSVQN
ncbi:hypothetical protein ILUMI_03472 [Ignelater luminosus]|uniref:DUF4817 domain-containing protein n=1 Tax=Ignelater luminosus TaxID=2038154 RepID=A0A8K0GIA7_IGNLU|nr:hypothetical protein ILUMI_03472 [Ignelater luminosus]